jgi:hypothetical protein
VPGRRTREIDVRELWVGCTPPPSHRVLNAAPAAVPAPVSVGPEIAAMKAQLLQLEARAETAEARAETAERIVLQLTDDEAPPPPPPPPSDSEEVAALKARVAELDHVIFQLTGEEPDAKRARSE